MSLGTFPLPASYGQLRQRCDATCRHVNRPFTDVGTSFTSASKGTSFPIKGEIALLEEIKRKSGAFFPNPSNSDRVCKSFFYLDRNLLDIH
jgi:hypothetical protein